MDTGSTRGRCPQGKTETRLNTDSTTEPWSMDELEFKNELYECNVCRELVSEKRIRKHYKKSWNSYGSISTQQYKTFTFIIAINYGSLDRSWKRLSQPQ